MLLFISMLIVNNLSDFVHFFGSAQEFMSDLCIALEIHSIHVVGTTNSKFIDESSPSR